ncbi:MAG: hypothetical protein KC503_35135 [Myxococcales bacterium]|nr:hypothetical protein [Myxococcales bacterium]
MLVALALAWSLALGAGTAAHADGPQQRAGLRARARHTGQKITGRLVRGVKWAAQSRVGQAIGKGANKLWGALAIDQHIANAYNAQKSKSRRQRNARFAEAVTRIGSSEIPRRIQIGKDRGTQHVLDGREIGDIAAITINLLEGLKATPIKVVHGATGRPKYLGKGQAEVMIPLVQLAAKVLSQREVRLSLKNNQLPMAEILQTPEVAAAVLAAWRKDPANAKRGDTWFMRRYQGAIELCRAIPKAFDLKLHWKGRLRDKSLSPSMDKLGTDEKTVVALAVRKRAPALPLQAIQVLTREYFHGVTHLWLDRILGPNGEQEAEAVKKTLPDDKARAMVDAIVAFKKQGAARVLAVREGKAVELDKRLRTTLRKMNDQIAGKILRSDFYGRAGDEARESFMRVVTVGLLLGHAIDHVASKSGSDLIMNLKPVVLGAWDDGFGAVMNYIEMKSRGDDPKKARKEFLGSLAAALGTSAAVALPLLKFPAIAEIMRVTPDPIARAVAWSAYGVLSSGGTIYMSFKPSGKFVDPIVAMVEAGQLPRPSDKHGKPLEGKALRGWAKKQARKTHLAFTAQQGGLVGVVASGVLGLAAGPLSLAGGPGLATALMAVLGATETITTGGYLHGREAVNRFVVSRKTNKELAALAKELEKGAAGVPAAAAAK